MQQFMALILQHPTTEDAVPFVAIDAPDECTPMTPAPPTIVREEGGISKRSCDAEYIQHCIQLPVLRYFFSLTSTNLWKHPIADPFFQKFLHRGNAEPKVPLAEPTQGS